MESNFIIGVGAFLVSIFCMLGAIAKQVGRIARALEEANRLHNRQTQP
jgi:hypothetical protein